jgi:hypothetical protein
MVETKGRPMTDRPVLSDVQRLSAANHIVRMTRIAAGAAILRGHRLVAHQHFKSGAKAVEARACRAIGAQHADLDIVARRDVGGKTERAFHIVGIIAGRAIEGKVFLGASRSAFRHLTGKRQSTWAAS